MSDSCSSLDIPLLSRLIAKEVEAFAQAHNLKPTLWYHGAPYWYVQRKEAGGLIREVHIAVYYAKGGERLYAIPQAYKYEGERRKISKPRPQQAEYTVRLLHHFHDESEVCRKIRILLEYAWLWAEAIEEDELVEG